MTTHLLASDSSERHPHVIPGESVQISSRRRLIGEQYGDGTSAIECRRDPQTGDITEIIVRCQCGEVTHLHCRYEQT